MLVDIQIAFLLTQVADVVAPGKDTPDSGPEAQSMPQNLEDDVSMIGAVAMPAKRGQTQSVRGVVRQIESAFQGERPVLCVVQSRLGSAHQPANSRASDTSALSGLFGPQRFSNAEGILASEQPDLGLRQRARHECALGLHALGQLPP